MSQPPLPPFRPPFPPPAGLPPFPPKGFPTPPFASNVSPNGSASPGVAGVRPPPSHYPPPGHSGLGYASSGLPHPPHQQSAQPPNKDVKTTKIFIGSIAPGIKDRTLRDLLMACGPLHELKRVEESTFAFAMFENPEVVLRCIRCLNGVELPDLSPDGLREGRRAKPLVVKADQKTTAFLQEFEDTLGRSEGDEAADAACRQRIAGIVTRLTAAQPGGGALGRSGRLSPINVVVPAHLQDLKEGDLPETQRVAVLDQIAIFRENAARRERDKKHFDDERDRVKPGASRPAAPVGYGYGTRAFPKAEAGPRSDVGNRPSNGGPHAADPQSYAEPVSFVRPATVEGKGSSERTDEEEEAIRAQRRERDKAMALRERESRVEARERHRLDMASREESVRLQRSELEAKNRQHLEEDLDHWDDDLEADKQSLFFVDRSQWRQQRQNDRLREEKDDVEDRRQEDAELKALEAESELFLQKQTAEVASLETRQRQAGLLTEDAAPIKLAISAKVAPEPERERKPVPAPAPPALALGDEEDDSTIRKSKRALVKLEYEQSLDEAEELAKRKARLLAITKQLPSSKGSAFSSPVDWRAVDKVRSKIYTFVQRTITDALGELDSDLAEFVMEHIDSHKGPKELLEELSPVLAEEADAFTLNLWRQLLLETVACEQNISTGSTTV